MTRRRPLPAAPLPRIIALCLDSGFAEMGYGFIELLPGGGDRIVDLGAFVTKADERKGRTLVSSDEFRRAQEVGRYLDELCTRHGRPSVICLEGQSYPRNSTTVRKMALAWGAAAAVSALRNLPCCEASPQRIKLALCKRRNASKEEVRAALEERYGEPLKRLLAPLSKKLASHPCDALGAFVACSHGDLVQLARGRLSPTDP